jgi:hypothetical protein
MYTKKIGMLVILSLSIATVAMGTTGLSLISPVFAGGDHHDHGDKKCKNNDDNNCNDTHKTQKIKAKNECEIENENKDHSHDNENLNELTCVNEAQNLKDVEQVDVFESNDTLAYKIPKGHLPLLIFTSIYSIISIHRI